MLTDIRFHMDCCVLPNCSYYLPTIAEAVIQFNISPCVASSALFTAAKIMGLTLYYLNTYTIIKMYKYLCDL